MDTTRVSLIARVRDAADEAAWAEFEARYGDLLRRYALARGLQSADADDVVQLAMLNLLKGLRSFAYDPTRGRFRDYLRRVVRNAISQYFARPNRANPALDTTILSAIPAESEHAADSVWEQEWMDHHYRVAMQTIRETFDAKSLEIFDLLLRGEDVAQVAAGSGMSDQAVYKVKQRIRDRLRELIAAQVREEDEPEAA